MITALLAATLALAPLQDKDALAALSKQLKDPAERTRREAVQALAKLDAPPAWSLVVEALKDVSPQVADEAQWQLVRGQDEAVLEVLMGKQGLGSGDTWVRQRAAEILGGLPGPHDLAKLVGFADDKEPGVRRAVAWAIERVGKSAGPATERGEAKPIQALEKLLAKEKHAGVRAALVAAVSAHYHPQKPCPSLAGTKDAAPEVRCAALERALGWAKLDDREALAKEVCADAAHAVRAQAIDILASCGTKSACLALVERMEKESSLRLRWRIVFALQRLSGSDLDLKPAIWRQWAEGLTDAWRPATDGAAPKRERKEQGTTVVMGLPVLSERVAILVDFSGSTWEKRADGKTRKQVLDGELASALEQLTPQTKFNLIPYTNAPIPWEKALVPASKENVARALEFFGKCNASGKGNVWDAFELAFADPEVDTILVLTDGAPTGGHRWHLELMKELFAEKNRFRKLALDAVLVDASRFLQERWTALCESNGGQMHAVELK